MALGWSQEERSDLPWIKFENKRNGEYFKGKKLIFKFTSFQKWIIRNHC